MYRDPQMVSFYRSKRWQRCRETYAASVGYLCERCAGQGIIREGEIVHHVIHLNPDNVLDPEIALGFGNLMLVCRNCHAALHDEMYGKNNKRYSIIEGRVVTKND